MEREKKQLGAMVDSPDFYRKAVAFVINCGLQARKLEGDNFRRICREEYGELSRCLDVTAIQNSVLVRNVLRTRRLASLLVDDKGVVDMLALKRLIPLIEESLYFLGPGYQDDAKAQEDLLKALKWLKDERRLVQLLQSIDKPHYNPYGDEIIRQTLQLPAKTTVNNAHARRAALSAWLCALRQTLGSCFATAPALLVHDEQPDYFFENIRELFATGRLTRTFGGIEYVVPLSVSWGPGDLKRPMVLPCDPAAAGRFLGEQPGLLNACEESGLIDANLTQKQKRAALEQLIAEGVADELPHHGTFATTPETLIEAILRRHFALTQQDLDDYGNRPRTLVHGSLMMQNPSSGRSSGGKGQACAQYTIALEQAKNGFKCLSDNALLKSWEFTLASFAETKTQFARWNLYSSLGLQPEEPGGIGACLYSALNERLQQCNREVEEHQEEYNQLYVHVKSIESRMRNAASEEELRWIRIDYQAKTSELATIQELRDTAHYRAQRYAALFQQLIDAYVELFPAYFQEVYDAEMMDVKGGIYDDSPAGFRLIYKHGRSNSAQWSTITAPQEFVDALASFFMAAERELEQHEAFEGVQEEVAELTSLVVRHVRTGQFLETAFHRMALAHEQTPIADPLKHLDQVEKKPWVYTSGGNLNTLLSCYFRREEIPDEVTTWVESPLELLAFFIDTLKQQPLEALQPFEENENKGMLIHSPTHSFLFKPGLPLLKAAWKSDEYSYTWLRDAVVVPMERALSEIRLNEIMMQFLVRQMLPYLLQESHTLFLEKFGNIKGALAPQDFSQYIAYGLEQEPALKRRGFPLIGQPLVDAVLFNHLPLTPDYQLSDRVALILSRLPMISEEQRQRVMALLEKYTPRLSEERVLSAQRLQDITLALIALATERIAHPHNFARLVKEVCVAEGICLPPPLIFADTNWPNEWFAFLVNPGNGLFELWRCDRLGNAGAPMDDWKKWLNGSQQQPKWGLYPRASQYCT